MKLSLAGFARMLMYLAGMGAVGLSIAGYGTFDNETWMFDLYPFAVDNLVKSLVSGAGNLLALVALMKGWRPWR